MEYDINSDGKTAVVNGKYVITRSGKVYRYHKGHRKWEHQKARVHSNGYLRATINGHDIYIHRLVALCFIANPRGCTEVNHKDGNKKNNAVENLEWCTRSENNRHAFQTGLRQYSELKEISRKAAPARMARRLFTDEQVKEIRREKSDGVSDRTLAEKYGCARGVIWQIANRTSYKEVV